MFWVHSRSRRTFAETIEGRAARGAIAPDVYIVSNRRMRAAVCSRARGSDPRLPCVLQRITLRGLLLLHRLNASLPAFPLPCRCLHAIRRIRRRRRRLINGCALPGCKKRRRLNRDWRRRRCLSYSTALPSAAPLLRAFPHSQTHPLRRCSNGWRRKCVRAK